MIAALSAAAVAALAPVSVTATSGPVTATLTGVGAAGGDTLSAVTDVRLTIARGGAVAFNRPLRPCRFGCAPEDPSGARLAALRLADLDGDGEPEVLVDRSDGFSPCCTLETASCAATRPRAATRRSTAAGARATASPTSTVTAARSS